MTDHKCRYKLVRNNNVWYHTWRCWFCGRRYAIAKTLLRHQMLGGKRW